MIDPENTGMITFDYLTIVMEDKLKETDTVEDLIEQLKKLDTDGDGKIPSPEFKQYMMNMGNQPMKSEDLEELMKEAEAQRKKQQEREEQERIDQEILEFKQKFKI